MTKDSSGNALNRLHRRRFLLSGLLVCGCCGGAFTVIGADRYGCATRRGKGTCDNRVTIVRQRIEARVLGALKARMLTPELVAEFVRAFSEALATSRREGAARQADLRQKLVNTERRLQGVLRAIEDGAWSDTLRTRLAELEDNKAKIAAQMDAIKAPSPVQLHPNAASLYAAKVADLEASLNAPDIRIEAAEALRALISQVVLAPDDTAEDRLRAELHGDLATILSLAMETAPASITVKRHRSSGKHLPPGTSVRGGQLSVVAGIGFEPMTFRL